MMQRQSFASSQGLADHQSKVELAQQVPSISTETKTGALTKLRRFQVLNGAGTSAAMSLLGGKA